MRLDKYISHALGVSRRQARDIIKAKQIKINGSIIAKNDAIIDEYNDEIYYQDGIIQYKDYIYIMMNKPKGYLSATLDEKFPTVMELVKQYKRNDLFMAGRLDIDSEGFVLLTNDGKFAHKLTSPNWECEKKYYVEVEEGSFKEADYRAFEEGMVIYDGNKKPFLTKPAILEILSDFQAYITIKEGKYHQIKKMCLKQGKKVSYLKRIEIGGIKLDQNLLPGESRLLTDEEITILKKQLT